MEEKKKRGRPKKQQDGKESLLKKIKIDKKPKITKTKKSNTGNNKAKSVAKKLKKLTIQRDSVAFPGIILNVTIWQDFTPFENINTGDEVITACGYHGFVISKNNETKFPYVCLNDIHGNGFRTVTIEAIHRLGEGKNNPDYIHEMKLRKMSKQRGNVATIENNNFMEENENE